MLRLYNLVDIVTGNIEDQKVLTPQEVEEQNDILEMTELYWEPALREVA